MLNPEYYAQANLPKIFVVQNPNYEIRTTELNLLLFTASLQMIHMV